MSGRFERRSKEAPMDFEFTSRKELPPDSPFRRGIEAAFRSSSAAEKRSRAEMEYTPSPASDPQHSFSIGASTANIPFLFNLPTIPASPQPEIIDVQMNDPSPQRPEDAKERRPIALGGVRREHRRRERALAKVSHPQAADESEQSSDDSDSATPIKKRPTSWRTSNHYTLNMPAPAPVPTNLPYVLLGYAQFFFNASLITLFLYLLTTFIITVQRDVQDRISQHSMDIAQEIASCSLSYRVNKCRDPLPALVQPCTDWEVCMARDPTVVGKTKVAAEFLAEVINSFVEPISWKTLLFTLSSVAFFTAFVNSILSLYRSKHSPDQPARMHNAEQPMPPATWWHPPEIEELPRRRRRMENGGSLRLS